jgi:transcriptional regulator with XRE-family HTH domain
LTDRESYLESQPMNTVIFNGERLKQARGSTPQTRAAEGLGISRQLLNLYEKGQWPSVPMLDRLLEFFQLSYPDLVVRQAEKKVARERKQ